MTEISAVYEAMSAIEDQKVRLSFAKAVLWQAMKYFSSLDKRDDLRCSFDMIDSLLSTANLFFVDAEKELETVIDVLHEHIKSQKLAE